MMRFYVLICICVFTSILGAEELRIKVIDSGWGDASQRDLSKVLNSAANTIWKQCKDIKLPPIQVSKGTDTPITLFKRAENGDLQVRLTSKDLFWSQHAYQFAHEFTHCLCRTKDGDITNLWFEESLCETASLFALRAMSKEWKKNPPYPQWKSYSESLHDYADALLNDPERSLADGISLPQWFKANEKALQENSVDREKNAVVAKELLKLFEKDPSQWQALFWINERKTDKKVSFQKYLKNWHMSVPDKHKKFILSIIELFKIDKR